MITGEEHEEKIRQSLAETHVVFISGMAPGQAEEPVHAILPANTLSIGDHKSFTKTGVMRIGETKVLFEKVAEYRN